MNRRGQTRRNSALLVPKIETSCATAKQDIALDVAAHRLRLAPHPAVVQHDTRWCLPEQLAETARKVRIIGKTAFCADLADRPTRVFQQPVPVPQPEIA